MRVGVRSWAVAITAGWICSARAFAGDILVPEATPAQLSDFSLSYLFYDMVISQLREQGLGVQDADAIRLWAGSDGDACFDNPDCPRLIWDHDAGGSVLIVLGIGQSVDGVSVNARLYRVGETEPAEELHETVASGNEDRYAVKIAGMATRLADGIRSNSPARILPSKVSEPAPRAEPRRSAEPDEDKDEDEDENPEPKTSKTTTVAAKPRAPEAPQDSRDDEQRYMGVPAGAYARFRESGLSRADWLKQKRVRTGHVSLELAGGYGMGDVDRGYGVRVRVENEEDGFGTVAASTWTGSGTGAGFAGTAALSYAPVWFLETSIQAGLLIGEKHLNVGWECPTDQCGQTSDTQTYDAVKSIEGFIEPRARILPIATGYVKPYLLVGVHLRLWDGFEVPDGSSVDYPDTTGGSGVGFTTGGGISFDVLPGLSLLIEVPYTFTLSDGAQTVDSADVEASPAVLESTGGLLRVSGGIGIHF